MFRRLKNSSLVIFGIASVISTSKFHQCVSSAMCADDNVVQNNNKSSLDNKRMVKKRISPEIRQQWPIYTMHQVKTSPKKYKSDGVTVTLTATQQRDVMPRHMSTFVYLGGLERTYVHHGTFGAFGKYL